MIYNRWQEAVEIHREWAIDTYGEVAEDRGSQVTFSMCGQDAPLRIKQRYDPDGFRRRKIIGWMVATLPDYEIRMGGTTSIDVTKKGLDKEYGVNRLLEYLNLKPEDAIFFGDALYEGGNDEPVKRTGVECIEVSGPEDTLQKIKELL
jgi:HAD superfamily hydrolase (TIGR01484 family)